MINEVKYLKALSKHIDKLRQERGLSYQEMALRCDIDKANTYRICKDGKGMTISTVLKIANGFDIDIADILNIKL